MFYNGDTMATPNCKSGGTSWSFATSWTIAGGSPSTVVNCVSSLDRQTVSVESVNTTKRRTPLILKPYSDNTTHCDIKICFMERRTIKKIYVRSTSRTFDVHFAPALESNDVYVCTVGCIMASQEKDVLHASDNKENRGAIFENSKMSNEETSSESDTDSTKDEWVVLGIPASPPDQDFFEAATEINDSYPCISVTLRLFYPDSEVLLHIDEILVIANALEPSDSENKLCQGENSVGFTLTTNLAPKLSQLSMSGIGYLQDEHAPSVVDGQVTQSGIPGLTETASGAELDGNCKTPDKPSPSQKRAHASDKEEKHDSPCCQVEKILEQLLAKVNKIEDLFMIHENKTLKPIINMEARLQKVEQYMELLAKSSKCPTESNSNAFQNGNPAPINTYKPADDNTSTSMNGSQLVPCLVVTAPTFSCDEDENKEDICLSKPQFSFSKGHKKKTFSVADCLDSFSDLNIQSPDSPLSFFHPSSQQVSSVQYTSKIDEKEFGQPSEVRQNVLESILGGFGQARRLGTEVPKSGSTSKNTFGCGFSVYKCNGFSKTAARGGSFATQASPVATSSDVPAADFRNEFAARVPSFSGPTNDSGGGFTARAPIFGGPTIALGVSATASGGGYTAPPPIFGGPTTALGGGLTAPATSFGVPTTTSGGGFTAPATNFGGFTAPETNFGGPATASGGRFTSLATCLGASTTASGVEFATGAPIFLGVPASASGGRSTAPANIYSVPATASGGGFTAPATSFGVPTTASGGGFATRAANSFASDEVLTAPSNIFSVLVPASGEGFTAPATGFNFQSLNCGVPNRASGGGLTAAATNIGVTGPAFGNGFNLSGGFRGSQQESNAFSKLANYGPTGIPPEVLARVRK